MPLNWNFFSCCRSAPRARPAPVPFFRVMPCLACRVVSVLRMAVSETLSACPASVMTNEHTSKTIRYDNASGNRENRQETSCTAGRTAAGDGRLRRPALWPGAATESVNELPRIPLVGREVSSGSVRGDACTAQNPGSISRILAVHQAGNVLQTGLHQGGCARKRHDAIVRHRSDGDGNCPTRRAYLRRGSKRMMASPLEVCLGAGRKACP